MKNLERKDEALGICECEFAYVALRFFEISALMTKVDIIPKLSIIIDYIYIGGEYLMAVKIYVYF